jgi:methylglyoxal synthase
MREREHEREETKTMLSADDWRPRRWRVALIAHDAMKVSLVAFVQRYRAQFKDWELLATASTGEALREATGLRLRTVLPGPRGGDLQIGAEIAAGEIDALIFLRDPLTAHPHEPDVSALLRVADVHHVAVATNLASAECLVRALSPEGAPLARG